jgi:peptidoglycan/LPS O-acetylase OafA/YrhL
MVQNVVSSDIPKSVSGRIPSLDGLRAVAIALVLVGHATHGRGFPASLRSPFCGDLARLGVTVFFVLSGFLITSLLVEEERRRGTISWGNFYIRRSLRILPPAFAFIAAVAALNSMGNVVLSKGDLLHAVTYTVNFHQDRAWALGNLWSLGVEEQFYLLWPLAFLWLRQRGAGWLAAAVIVLVPVLRVLAWISFEWARRGIDEQFELVCDGLATGCLLALLVARYGLATVTIRVPPACFVIAPIALGACMALDKWPSFALPCGTTIINLSVALIMLWCIANADSAPGRLLNSRVAVFGGAISYSLYLWQQLFTDRSLLPQSFPFPVNVFATLVAAVLSFYLLERPLEGIRRRFSDRQLPPQGLKAG